MPVATFPLGPLQTNSYLIHNAERAVAVDVGGEPAPMLEYLTEHKLALSAICLTHRHFDHLYGVAELAGATKAVVYAPTGDDSLAETESGRGGIWGFPPVPPFDSLPMPTGQADFGGMECRVLETPGHTPGGVSLYFPAEKLVFTGDALFYRSMGRTDFPGGSWEQMTDSLQKLAALPGDFTVLPGHGPASTLDRERRCNPYLRG